MTRPDKKLTAIFLSVIGGISFLVPIGFWWYISDYDRYLAMIRGPYPFHRWGSSPVQLFSFGAGPVILGIGLLCLSYWLVGTNSKDRRVALAVGVIGISISVLLLSTAFL